ncbi:unnamed protein product, partial [Mesorhabditis spiculigera]
MNKVMLIPETTCFRSFSRSFNLARHIATRHTSPLHFVCPQCDRTYKNSMHFADHIRTHNGELFGCDDCGKHFPARNSLRAHKKNDHREKRICGVPDT